MFNSNFHFLANATSILDYIFRELAISYLGRNELAHVDPSDIGHDVLGKGEDQSRLPPTGSAKFVSHGFVRSKVDKLMLVQGSGPQAAKALKGDLAAQVEAELGGLEWTTPAERASIAEKRSQARVKGYTGEACAECGNFTLIRNGTCLKCDTCGATSGCS